MSVLKRGDEGRSGICYIRLIELCLRNARDTTRAARCTYEQVIVEPATTRGKLQTRFSPLKGDRQARDTRVLIPRKMLLKWVQ